MKMNEMITLNRRQEDRFQQPKGELQWEVRKRRDDDFVPPDAPLDWSDAEPIHQPESKK